MKRVTSEEYAKLDIVERLQETRNTVLDEDNDNNTDHDIVVYQIGGSGLQVSDMLIDAINKIKRFRKEITIALLEYGDDLELLRKTLNDIARDSD